MRSAGGDAVPEGPHAIPEVRLESAARALIRERGGAVTLRGSRRLGCCGGTAFVPVAEPVAPRRPERYRALEVDGVTVYLEHDVAAGPDPLVVGVDGAWRWRRLRVEGTAIRMGAERPVDAENG
jgi:hypothetical protein